MQLQTTTNLKYLLTLFRLKYLQYKKNMYFRHK